MPHAWGPSERSTHSQVYGAVCSCRTSSARPWTGRTSYAGPVATNDRAAIRQQMHWVCSQRLATSKQRQRHRDCQQCYDQHNGFNTAHRIYGITANVRWLETREPAALPHGQESWWQLKRYGATK